MRTQFYFQLRLANFYFGVPRFSDLTWRSDALGGRKNLSLEPHDEQLRESPE